MVDWVCDRWKGTPWVAGQRLRGVGVDCVNFATAVLDELASVPEPTKLSRRIQDSGLHRSGMTAAAQTFLEVSRVHHLRPIAAEDGILTVEPGDLLVHRLGRCGEAGHVSVVAWHYPSIYHAMSGRGVRLCAMPREDEVLYAWRPAHKERWNGRLDRGP